MEKSPRGPRLFIFNKNGKLDHPTDSILKFVWYHTNPLVSPLNMESDHFFFFFFSEYQVQISISKQSGFPS